MEKINQQRVPSEERKELEAWVRGLGEIFSFFWVVGGEGKAK